MTITMATDLALKRQIWFTQNVNQLVELMIHSLVMKQYDECERIVNKNGIVISKWK